MPTQFELLEIVSEINRQFGLDYWHDLDRKKEPPFEYWTAVCGRGLAGIPISREYGGMGLGISETAQVVEKLAEGGAGSTVAQLFIINTLFGALLLQKFGNDKQKNELIPKILSADLSCCIAMTEPAAGSNALAITTHAVTQDDGSYGLNGEKIWATLASISDKMLVIARTKTPEESSSRTDGISMFFIDSKRPGIAIDEIEKLGIHTLPSCRVSFKNVRVKADEVTGTLHKGFGELFQILNAERIIASACLLGTVWLAQRIAVEFANSRVIFEGKPISSYQGLQFPLAESYAEARAAQLMNNQAAQLYDQDAPCGTESNIAKLLSGKIAFSVCDHVMQMFGGMGYADESHIERLWRDARLLRIAPVTEEMCLNYLATHCLGMERSY